jgi:hypothetical protein
MSAVNRERSADELLIAEGESANHYSSDVPRANVEVVLKIVEIFRDR